MDLAFRHDIYHTLDKENSVIDNYELVLDGQVSCMIVIVTCEKRNFVTKSFMCRIVEESLDLKCKIAHDHLVK